MVARAHKSEHQTENAISPDEKLTPQEYLRREREAEFKSELINGELFAMAGASKEHIRINSSVAFHLTRQLLNSPCEVAFNDLRVKINEAGNYVYPDILVFCDDGEWEDKQFDTLLNPRIIIEVLSSSTSQRDHEAKWPLYQQLPSLTDYLMVAQHRRHVQHYARQNETMWLYSIHATPESEITLASINSTLTLQEIYERVSFDEEPTTSV
jgi:Uma2 family endonuclease